MVKTIVDATLLRSLFGGWYIPQPCSRKLLEESMDENEPWLLIRIPSEDAFLVIWCWERLLASLDQHVKELMPVREGLHVTTQGYMRQHDACRHSASWRESTRRKFMKYVIRKVVGRTCLTMVLILCRRTRDSGWS